MTGYSVLGFCPVEAMHSFKFIKFGYVGVAHWFAIDGLDGLSAGRSLPRRKR